ncbi:MAG: hypothetical protein Q4A15_07670 [Prevotellaceae bacterium]|nr:hypothetical protein [Prevotellaceae bacterium]
MANQNDYLSKYKKPLAQNIFLLQKIVKSKFGITRYEIAKHANLSDNTFSKLHSYPSKASFKTLALIYGALGLDVNDFLILRNYDDLSRQIKDIKLIQVRKNDLLLQKSFIQQIIDYDATSNQLKQLQINNKEFDREATLTDLYHMVRCNFPGKPSIFFVLTIVFFLLSILPSFIFENLQPFLMAVSLESFIFFLESASAQWDKISTLPMFTQKFVTELLILKLLIPFVFLFSFMIKVVILID